MSFAQLSRLIHTASFGLVLLYAVLFATSTLILGLVVYWTVQASADRQLAMRIDAEVRLLEAELRSDGAAELEREVEKRVNYAGNLEYFLADQDGKRLTGTLPSMPAKLGWSDVVLSQSVGQPKADPKRFRVESVILDNGFRTRRRRRSRIKGRYSPGISRRVGLGTAHVIYADTGEWGLAQQGLFATG